MTIYFMGKTKCNHEIGRQAIGGIAGHEHIHASGEQVCLDCGKSLTKIIEEAFEEGRAAGRWEKIFCKHCDGKGYFTRLRGKVVASADFIGDVSTTLDGAREVMTFCDCDRGKKLRQFFQTHYYKGRQDGANSIARMTGMPKDKMLLILNDEMEKYDDGQY
jgi:hypothetical protein